MSVEDGKRLPERSELVEYFANCIDKSAEESGGYDFYFVHAEDEDGPRDICHTGNGPKSRANAERIAACVNACAGIGDPSVIPELVAFLESFGEWHPADPFDPTAEEARALLSKLKRPTATTQP